MLDSNDDDDILSIKEQDNHHTPQEIEQNEDENNMSNKTQSKLNHKEENESKALNKFNSLSEPNIIDDNKFNLQEIIPENQYIDIIEPITDLNDYYSSLDERNNSNQNNVLTMNDLIGPEMNKEITLEIMNENFNSFFPGKVSKKSYGYISAYAANTNQGIVRDYNEDRVSIIININQPNNYNGELPWPKASFFSVFDGHGGHNCAEFLRDNLLNLICNNIYYPSDIENAIKFGFEQVDKLFLSQCVKDGEIIDNSGSCALILLIIENKIYIANVGDSRCLISMQNGLIRRDVTRDHKPNYPYEKERILSNGGNIYQTQTPLNQNIENENQFTESTQSAINENNNINNLILLGPFRVYPGSLSVSRTIGDVSAKLSDFGGNPNVVISEPDIYCFDLEKNDIDFLILGCDGIYDHLTSKDVFNCAWTMIDYYRNYNLKIEEKNKNEDSQNNEKIDIYTCCANIVDFILKASMSRKSFDNVTCVIVSFKDFINGNNSNHLQSKKNEKFIINDKENDKLPRIVNNINNIVENSQSPNLKNKITEENKKLKFPKKLIGEKIQINSIQKENKKENKTFENILNKNINLNFNKNEYQNKKKVTSSGEISQRIKTNKIFNDFNHKIDENNPKNNSLSTKKFKDNFNNYNTFSNGEKDIINYNAQILNNNKNISKEKRRNNKRKKLFFNKKIKPLFIDNQNNIYYKDQNKLVNNHHNLQLKLITLNPNFKKNNKEEGPIVKTISQVRDINFYKNKKDKDSIFINDNPKMPNINTIDSNINNKYKITLNNLLPIRNNKNNLGLKLKNLNKKSISFYNNNLINNLKLNHDKNLYMKNIQSPSSNFNLINFNRLNRINLHLGINKDTLNEKYRFSSEDRNNTKNRKNIDFNSINKDNNINNNKMNKYNQTHIINKKKMEKKLVHNLTEDLLSDKKRLIIPSINLKNNPYKLNKTKKLNFE